MRNVNELAAITKLTDVVSFILTMRNVNQDAMEITEPLVAFYINYEECKCNCSSNKSINEGLFYINYEECKSNSYYFFTITSCVFYINYEECK